MTTTQDIKVNLPEEMSALDMDADDKKAFEDSTDFANYFCTYGYLYHQKSMLTDELRMKCYSESIFKNKACFENKVVLDVGTGSGILSIWAAQAGAKKVYAVEATQMATQARRLCEANGVADIVTVIQSKVEDVQLPEKVDVIISEWMGYFLLRESMLDSVLLARDKWLKPGGALYPSHATMYMCATKSDEQNAQRMDECCQGINDWDEFVGYTKEAWGVDMSCLTPAFKQEQEGYSLYTSLWTELPECQVLGEPVAIKSIDIGTCTLEDIKEVHSAFDITFPKNSTMGGFCGWFDVDFRGSPENPAPCPVTLPTSPYVQPTHWGQQLFLTHPVHRVAKGDRVTGTIRVTRRNDNQRLMRTHVDYEITGQAENAVTKKSIAFNIE